MRAGEHAGASSPLREGGKRQHTAHADRPRSGLKSSSRPGTANRRTYGDSYGDNRRTHGDSTRDPSRPLNSINGRPKSGLQRPATARSVLFQDADAAYAASDYSGSDDDAAREGQEAVGTGIDIALHLHPSKPGIGHTLYSDWQTKDYQPKLHRLNIVDYLTTDSGEVKPYQEDLYYEGASIPAVDYWNLKRVAREIRKGERGDGDVFCSSSKAANLLRIDALVPSRQVKFEAGARIRAILCRYCWLWRRNKAAVKMQATYRMYLTKVITRTKRAEQRQMQLERGEKNSVTQGLGV